MNKILLLSSSESDRRMLKSLLTRTGYEPIAVESMETAKEEVAKLPPGAVIVTDYKLSDGSAKELIDWMKETDHPQPVIVIVDRMDALVLHEVMRNHGAVDIVQRPAVNIQLSETIRQYVHNEAVSISKEEEMFPALAGESFSRLESVIDRTAVTKANVIIFGESGTGKEQIARMIWKRSSRRNMPLTILEAGGAALVGKYDPTSGNSKIYDRISGYFTKTKGGTIIIKNVQLLSFDKQSVLLHILANEQHDVRVICTASTDLLEMVRTGEFRDSLFYFLRQTDITVPALREISEDIPTIAEHILNEYAKESGSMPKHLDASAKKALKFHPWPGNMRELKYLLKLSAHHTTGEILTAENLLFSQSEPEPYSSLRLNDPEMEKQRITDALRHVNGHREKASELLGISRNTLYKKMKLYGISFDVK